MKRNIVIMNGPKLSGKDYLSNYLVKNSKENAINVCFKERLNSICRSIYGISPASWFLYTRRSQKENPQDKLGGKSSRQVQIEVSEKLIKPFYGDNFFGVALKSSIEKNTSVKTFYVSDGGFERELEPLISKDNNILIVKIEAEKCKFDSTDSRDYLPDDFHPEINRIMFFNNKDEDSCIKLKRLIDSHLEKE